MDIYINGEIKFEYNNSNVLNNLDAEKIIFLDKMDLDMNSGIRVNDKLINNPDVKQRATFVAMNLIKGLLQDNGAVIASSCAYLTHRYPTLAEIHANDTDKSISIELINDAVSH